MPQEIVLAEEVAINLTDLASGNAVCSEAIDLGADAPEFVLEIELNLGVELPASGTVQYFIVPASTFDSLGMQLGRVADGNLELDGVLKYCQYLGYVALDASDGCGAIQLRFVPTGERAYLIACNRTAIRFPHKLHTAGHALQIMPWAKTFWEGNVDDDEDPEWLDDLD